MVNLRLSLQVLDGHYGIVQLEPSSPIPVWASQGDFFSITKTKDELSLVCHQDLISDVVRSDKGWRLFKIQGPFAFDQVGILNTITAILADNKIGLFALSTFDTDYLLVKAPDLDRAIDALRKAGQIVLNG